MFNNLPFEINDLIYKHLHKSCMIDLNNEFDEIVEDNKYSGVSNLCLAGCCDCNIGECRTEPNEEFNPYGYLSKFWKIIDSDSDTDSDSDSDSILYNKKELGIYYESDTKSYKSYKSYKSDIDSDSDSDSSEYEDV